MVAEGTWELGIWASDILIWAKMGAGGVFSSPTRLDEENQWDHSEATMRLNRPLKADSFWYFLYQFWLQSTKNAQRLKISVGTSVYPAHSLGFRPNPKPYSSIVHVPKKITMSGTTLPQNTSNRKVELDFFTGCFISFFPHVPMISPILASGKRWQNYGKSPCY